MIEALAVFVCGALYEAGCVGFIHYSERGRPFLTALYSMLTAAVEICGIVVSVHDFRLAVPFVLGYGAGSYLAVAWKIRHARGRTQEGGENA